MDLRDNYCKDMAKGHRICIRINIHAAPNLCDKCMNQPEYIARNKMTLERIELLKNRAKRDGRVLGKKPCGCSKVGNIVVAYWYLFWDIVKRRRASRDIRHRYMVCVYCEHHTWLTWAQWFTNLKALPKQPYKRGHKMFCRICKCYIEGKIRDKLSKCSERRWSK